MLVINANNQQNTTNYMLADPWYPDIDSILMYGCPNTWLDNIVNIDNDEEITPNDITVVDIIWGTYPINMYCPKINREALFSWQSIRTSITTLSAYNEYYPDLWFINKLERKTVNNANHYRFQYWYNIAVKWLQAWQVVGEKIYAPLLLGVNNTSNNINFCGLYYNLESWTNFYSDNIATVTFKLLHSDGTTTTIASVIPYILSHNLSTLAGTISNSTAITSDGTEFNGSVYSNTTASQFWYIRLEGRYDWTWQTAQAWDMLVAEVRINGAFSSRNSGATTASYYYSGWVYGGWANNNSMRDVYWFRPFQVSIRDS